MATTAAQRVLDKANAAYEICEYDYVEKGGTRASSTALGVDEHCVIKTLVFEDDKKKPLIVLMHGDKQVSAKSMARILGVKKVSPCAPKVAQKHSGYMVGGTSPFGTKKALPVYMQESIAELDEIYINAGRRGMLAKMSPQVVVEILSPTLVDAES